MTHKLTPATSVEAVQGAKSLASRGFAGLKAAGRSTKEGIGGLLSGDVLQTGVGVFTGPGITPDAAGRAGPGRHPVDVLCTTGRPDERRAPPSYTCPYCRTTSTGAGTTCPNCGAPVDVGPPHRLGLDRDSRPSPT